MIKYKKATENSEVFLVGVAAVLCKWRGQRALRISFTKLTRLHELKLIEPYRHDINMK